MEWCTGDWGAQISNHVPFLRMDGINQGLLKILFQLCMCTCCILDICFMVEF